MAKNFSIQANLPIRPEYEGMINIIALANKWTPKIVNPATFLPQTILIDGVESPNPDYSAVATIDNPVTPIAFIESFMAPALKSMVRSIISESLSAYYGMSQSGLISAAMADFETAFVSNVSFVDVNA